MPSGKVRVWACGRPEHVPRARYSASRPASCSRGWFGKATARSKLDFPRARASRNRRCSSSSARRSSRTSVAVAAVEGAGPGGVGDEDVDRRRRCRSPRPPGCSRWAWPGSPGSGRTPGPPSGSGWRSGWLAGGEPGSLGALSAVHRCRRRTPPVRPRAPARGEDDASAVLFTQAAGSVDHERGCWAQRRRTPGWLHSARSPVRGRRERLTTPRPKCATRSLCPR